VLIRGHASTLLTAGTLRGLASGRLAGPVVARRGWLGSGERRALAQGQSLFAEKICEMSRRPHRYVGEFGVVQISVATDDCIGFGCAGKH
jgi:hypothetical protein